MANNSEPRHCIERSEWERRFRAYVAERLEQIVLSTEERWQWTLPEDAAEAQIQFWIEVGRGSDRARDALLQLIAEAEQYQRYHDEKFYAGLDVKPTGLRPAIALARAAAGEHPERRNG